MTDEELHQALNFAGRNPARLFRVQDGAVCIGEAAELTDPAARAELRRWIQAFGPWRKGPFELFGERIDANWKSDWKWDRIAAYLDAPPDARVCDLGCNNGYYLFRLAEAGVQRAVGYDPAPVFQRAFAWLNAFARRTELEFRPAGFEALAEEPAAYDALLCMGLLYHHSDPVRILRLCHGALRPGGQLIIESLALPQSCSAEPIALAPRGRYAGMKSVWSVPNAAAIASWLERTNFSSIEFRGEFRYADEQVRVGELPGLAENLSAEKPELTLEGYPAPVRVYFSARKPGARR